MSRPFSLKSAFCLKQIGRACQMSACAAALSLSFGGVHAAHALEVVASIRPLQSLVSAVMQDVGAPTLIVQGAGSPHGYTLRPNDAKALAGADIIFWAGPDLETFLQKPLATIALKADKIALKDTKGLTILPAREGGNFEPHDHDHEGHHHDDKKDDHDSDHAHHDTPEHEHDDLHFWLDPQNASLMVDEIARALAQKDPQNAEKYRANAARYQLELQKLQRDVAKKLAPIQDRPFIVFHDAYQYYEKRFGVNLAGSVTINPEHMPSVERVRALRQKIIDLHAVCVFSEPQFQSKLVNTLIEGTKAKTASLDPLGYTIAEGREQYIHLIENLTDSLVACLKP